MYSEDYNLIFLDVEATGTGEDDRLCQVAYKTDDEMKSQLFYPNQDIPPEASAVHHITDKDVKGKEVFIDSEMYNFLKERLEEGGDVLVAHNAQFDIAMLKKERVFPEKYICTLKVARYLDKHGKLTKFGLQYLRYLLDVEIDARAHDAKGDIKVLECIFERQYDKAVEEGYDEPIKKMIEISDSPVRLKRMPFGKHEGRKFNWIAQNDRDYLEWLFESMVADEDDNEDMIHTLNYHLGNN